MKKLLTIIAVAFSAAVFAQDSKDLDAIKLYIDKQVVERENQSYLNPVQADRLFQRTSQLINQVGITEYGYSTFLVTPKLNVVNSTESDAGIAKTVFVECELYITVKRVFTKSTEGEGSATMKTFFRKVMGSGYTKPDAIANAITTIRSGDPDIIQFFSDAKKEIDAYYKAHCKDVLKDAQQALDMKQHAKSIALSFSIPKSAPCYAEASDLSQKVYSKFVEDECKDQVLKMKANAALAERDPSQSDRYYREILTTMASISFSDRAAECRAVAEKVIADIEKKLDEKQKREWELDKLQLKDEKELRKERFKAIQSMYNSYAPGSSVIITR